MHHNYPLTHDTVKMHSSVHIFEENKGCKHCSIATTENLLKIGDFEDGKSITLLAKKKTPNFISADERTVQHFIETSRGADLR